MEQEQLDFTALSPEDYFKKTNFAPWGSKVKKVEYSNKRPSGYSFIGLNLQRELFKDVRVRKALAHLFNREFINEKFMYNKRDLARGPWYFWSEYADPSVSPILFDVKEAKRLLREAGWTDKNQNAVLEKNIKGVKKEFEFTLMIPTGESEEKWFTFYQQDLKKAGIKLNLKFLGRTSLLKMTEDKNFDAVFLYWSGGAVDFDPKQL